MNASLHRTRIKMCGLTRPDDVVAAAQAGADALGFVLYPPSPRAVSVAQLRDLIAAVPPMVTPVLLFVNAQPAEVEAALEVAPHALLQFHGDETPADCARYLRPYLRAARIGNDSFDLLKYAQQYPHAAGILLDTWSDGYGGSGHTFDWTRLNTWSPHAPSGNVRLVLSGGLTPANVADGIRLIRPWAVDVSSGIEQAKGLKNPALMQAFVAAVRSADASFIPTTHV
ncbi:MAG: hypothetical protein RLZZ397_683 [Pseudomonadota bacterium]|jgi:phosphoribosylanthranilate isomerase